MLLFEKGVLLSLSVEKQLSLAWEIPQLAAVGIAGYIFHPVNLILYFVFRVNALITHGPPMQISLNESYTV